MTGATFARSLLLSSFLTVAYSSAAQEVYDYSWAIKNEQACADQLFGRHEDSVGDPLYTTLVVTAKVSSDDFAERQVTLVEKGAGALQGRFIRVVGRSIQDQLFKLHEAEPRNAVSDLCSKISVQVSEVSSEKRNELYQLVEELGRQRFALTPESLVVIHGVEYEVWISSGQWEAHFEFVDASSEDERAPLAQWVDRLFSLVSNAS
jgi:hypothetical protein